MYILDTNVVSELRKAKKADQNVKKWAQPLPPSGLYISVDGYLLDSPSPYRLWFRFDLPSGVKDSIQGNGLDCQGLLHEAKEELAAAF